MRILFFCKLSAVPENGKIRKETGCSWISVLIHLLHTKRPDWVIGVCGEGEEDVWGKETDECLRYPISETKKIISRLKKRLFPEEEEKQLLPSLQRAIHDFKPDIIHIFGSEFPYGVICQWTDVPCIIHFQGCLPAYLNAKYPPGMEAGHYFRQSHGNLLKMERAWYFDRMFAYRAKREERILSTCQNYFGRTEWDKVVIEQYHPGANYFYCSEILRDTFYDSIGRWKQSSKTRITIVSLISTPIYKGQDLILKTAKLLKGRLDFQWKVIGVPSEHMKFWERQTGIQCDHVNVVALGSISDADKLKEKLLSADIYFHPSYIENSPNSLCEAQILGMPCLATVVGGVSSLVQHGETGILVPANDPYMAAHQIQRVAHDSSLAYNLGHNASKIASMRHNRDAILNDCIHAYQTILKNKE